MTTSSAQFSVATDSAQSCDAIDEVMLSRYDNIMFPFPFKMKQSTFEHPYVYVSPTYAYEDLKTMNVHKSHESFRTALFKTVPLLESFLSPNLVLAGGAPCCIMRDMTAYIQDYDLYMIDSGTNIRDHSQLYVSTLTAIANAVRQKYHYVKVKKTIGNTEIRGRSSKKIPADDEVPYPGDIVTIQLMHRVYQSANDILTGFDIGSAMLLFDGQKLYTNKIGEFAYKHSCNVCTPSNERLLALSARLHKYYLRGFDIIFPDIDYNKLINIKFVTTASDDEVAGLLGMGEPEKELKFAGLTFVIDSDTETVTVDECGAKRINAAAIIAEQVYNTYEWHTESESTVLAFPMTILSMTNRRHVVSTLYPKPFDIELQSFVNCPVLHALPSLLAQFTELVPTKSNLSSCLRRIYKASYCDYIVSEYLQGGHEAITPVHVQILIDLVIAIETLMYQDQLTRLGILDSYTYIKDCPKFSWPAEPKLCSKWYGKYYIHADSIKSETIKESDLKAINSSVAKSLSKLHEHSIQGEPVTDLFFVQMLTKLSTELHERESMHMSFKSM
jgi:hypothetical protein